MTVMKKTLFILIALFGLFLGVLAQQSFRQEESVDLSVSFQDLKGQSQSMDAWKGKVLVVNFWASWCPPCVEEMPLFQSLQEQFASRGLQFVGIAIDEPDAVRKFLAESPVTYPILMGGQGGEAWALKLGNSMGVLPFSAIFDASGRLVYRKLGAFDEAELSAQIVPLLGSGVGQH